MGGGVWNFCRVFEPWGSASWRSTSGQGRPQAAVAVRTESLGLV